VILKSLTAFGAICPADDPLAAVEGLSDFKFLNCLGLYYLGTFLASSPPSPVTY
jgi:hypothetical protein